MNCEEEWNNVAAEVIYGLDILISHYINDLDKEDLEVLWKTQDLMKKLMSQPMTTASEIGIKWRK
jgi:hypothetical protein